MNEEDTYEALREILPQLQHKLRETIEQEYREQMQKAHGFYLRSAEEMVAKKQEQMQQRMEENECRLRKELSLMQRERQQWLLLEQNYRTAIFELTEKARERNDLSALTEITTKHQITEQDNGQSVAVWKKKTYENKGRLTNQRQRTAEMTASKYSIDVQKKGPDYDTPSENTQREEDNLLEERPLQKEEGRDKAWRGNNYPNESDMKQRGRRQDTLVLSPPRLPEDPLKSSLINPPKMPPSNSASPLFWNADSKKRLLSMIRNIK